MRILRYELRKMFSPFSFLFLLLLLLLNAVTIYRASIVSSDAELVVRNAEQRLKEELSGPLSEKNQKFLQEEFERLTALSLGSIPASDSVSHQYTGNAFSDLSVIRSVKNEYDYFRNYGEYAREQTERAEKIADSASRGYQSARAARIAEIFSLRSLGEYYDLSAWNRLFQYESSTLYLILFLIFFLTPVFVLEKENNMNTILLTSVNGRFRTSAAKFGVAYFCVLLFAAVFYAEDYFLYRQFYRMEGAHVPLCSLPIFQDTPLDVSLAFYYLISCLTKTVGLLALSALFLFVSSCFRRTMPPLLINISVFFGLVLLFSGRYSVLGTLFNRVNPITLLNPSLLFSSCTFLCIFDTPVPSWALTVVAMTVLFLLFGLCTSARTQTNR
ncbi:MAG: hypothetical protein ACI4WZ_01970 [Eubacteriales bacterium]